MDKPIDFIADTETADETEFVCDRMAANTAFSLVMLDDDDLRILLGLLRDGAGMDSYIRKVNCGTERCFLRCLAAGSVLNELHRRQIAELQSPFGETE